MENSKVDLYVTANAKYFDASSISLLKTKLQQLDEEKFLQVQSVDLKDPTTLLLISIFLGSFGVDRFMLGDIGMGILKLLTMGCCGILTIVDWFTISKKTKERNLKEVLKVC